MRIALVGLGGMGGTHYLNYLHIPNAIGKQSSAWKNSLTKIKE